MMIYKDDVPIVPLSFPDKGFWIVVKGLAVKVIPPVMLSPDFSSWKFPEKLM